MLYYSKYKHCIKKHILEQINYRVNSMDKKCYDNGQCNKCGCETIALQMANKACDKPCYPEMIKKSKWEEVKKKKKVIYVDKKSGFWIIDNKKQKFYQYEQHGKMEK